MRIRFAVDFEDGAGKKAVVSNMNQKNYPERDGTATEKEFWEGLENAEQVFERFEADCRQMWEMFPGQCRKRLVEGLEEYRKE